MNQMCGTLVTGPIGFLGKFNNDYFGDDFDELFVTYIQNAINTSNAAINAYTIASLVFLPTLYVRQGWVNTRNTLQDMNQNYKALITDTNNSLAFTGQCKVETYDYGNITRTQYFSAGDPSECNQYNQDNGSFSEIISQPVYNYNVTFGPSDGLINAASSLAWKGATHILMPGSNHGQMKNDGNTKAVLTRIYNAGQGINPWWEINPR